MLLNNNQREALFGQEEWRFPGGDGQLPKFPLVPRRHMAIEIPSTPEELS